MKNITDFFYPKLFSLLKGNLDRKRIGTDIISGIVVGIVALPLAIAFAIASGVSPEKGILTAIIAGFLISLFGGSRVQIGGPTGAFVVIVHGIVTDYGMTALFYSTIIGGALLILFGVLQLGKLLKYIPHPMIIGFTSGIAVIIFTSQIKDALGLNVDKMPDAFIQKWIVIFQNIRTINISAFVITLVTIIIIFLLKKKFPRIPGTFAVLILTSVIVKVFHIPVSSIGTLFGKISMDISFLIPQWDESQLFIYLKYGFIIALLGGMESLLSATVADGMISGHHRSNTELIGQGIANVITPLFGGIPATGAIARTAVNVQNGGRTPIAGISHSVTLLILLLFFKEFLVFIPMSCLAGILIIVSINMSEYKSFSLIMHGNNFDKLIMLVTFLVTIFFNLALAIEIGIVLSSLLFMKRMTDVAELNGDNSLDSDVIEMYAEIPQKLAIFEISGPFFFATARLYSDRISNTSKESKVLIIRMRHVSFLDQTGLLIFKDMLEILKDKRVTVILSGVNENIRIKFEKNDVNRLIPKGAVFDSFNQALERAKSLLEVKSHA